jgi:hypothetical protein
MAVSRGKRCSSLQGLLAQKAKVMTAKRVQYPAVVDKDPDSDYGVVFPDFPAA